MPTLECTRPGQMEIKIMMVKTIKLMRYQNQTKNEGRDENECKRREAVNKYGGAWALGSQYVCNSVSGLYSTGGEDWEDVDAHRVRYSFDTHHMVLS